MKIFFRIFGGAASAAVLLFTSANAALDLHTPVLLDNNNHTHNTPSTQKSAPYLKVAGVYWLPDYLEKNLDFNNQTQGGGEKPKVDPTCNNLGYAVPSFVTDWSKYTYTEFLAANRVRCYKNFLCKDNFSKSSCPQWYQLAGNSCRDTRGTLYERCDPKPCPSSYTAGVGSCSPAAGYDYSSNGYSGAKICGRCLAKACPPNTATSLADKAGYVKTATSSYSGSSVCYQYTAAPCTGYGAKKEGSGWNCSDTCLSGTTTKYKCVAKACAEGSLSPNCDSVNYNTVNTSSYSGDSVCKKCTLIPCPASKDCTYGCKTWDDYRLSICDNICIECKTCAAGGSATCSGQTAACNTATQVQTASCKDCAGTMHYACRAKTCAELGQKDCNGSCIAKTACCGGCASGAVCSNSTCVCPTGKVDLQTCGWLTIFIR